MACQTLERVVCACLLMGCLAQAAQAQSSPTEAIALLQQAERMAQPQEAWLLLQSHVNEHLKNAHYNYALGIYAAKSGQYAHAINALERVVLIQPNYAAAWLDLSLAYAGAGDYATAAELANHILIRLDPPAHIVQLLAQQLPLWQQAAGQSPPKIATDQLSFDMGYSTNPSAHTQQEMVPLFLGQWINLPLLAQERARGSSLVGVGWQGYRLWQQHRVYSHLSLRQTPDNELANQWSGSLHWLFPEDAYGSWQLAVDHISLHSTGDQSNVSVARNLSLSAAWQLRLGYRLRTGSESSYLAQLPSLTLSYLHSINAHHKLRVYASAEQDNPLAERPGGQGKRVSAGGVWDTRFENGYGLLLSYAISHYSESEPYSSLLPIARSLNWQQWRAQFSLPIDAQWSVALLVQHEQQEANHALFSWQDTQYVGKLSYAF